MASKKPEQDQAPEVEQQDVPKAPEVEQQDVPKAPAAVTLHLGDATVVASSPTLVTKLKSEGWEVAE